MREGVTVIGGFEGSETQLKERRVALDADSLSVLSGGGKYRVLLQEKVFATPTVWDGFMLTGGVASKGAGIWLREGGVMRNSLIESNTAGKLSIGEMAEAEGGIVIAIAASKACIIGIGSDGSALLKERTEIEFGLEGVFLGTDAGDEPFRASATGDDGITAGIAVDELHLIPQRGHILHELHSPFGSVGQVVGCHGEMLHARLEEHGGGQGEYIAGATDGTVLVVGIIKFVQRRAAKIHRAHHIADKGVGAGIRSLSIAGTLTEV